MPVGFSVKSVRPAFLYLLLFSGLTASDPTMAGDERSDISIAIRQGNLDAVRAIVAKNPWVVKSADDSGFTPLHIAATAGRVEIIGYLLDRGADIEARTTGGQTPLFQTIPLSAGEAFGHLLEKGANLNARDNEGLHILQFALSWRRPAMVELILSRGFRVEAQGAGMQEMLDAAANIGILSLVDAILAKSPALDTGNRNGTTLLHSAARGGLPGLAKQLLKQGAHINERDLHGLTPLHLAAFYGRDEVVRLLVAEGADIDVQGFDGRMPVDMADYGGHASAANLLKAKGTKARPAVFPKLSGLYLGQSQPDSEPRIFAPGIISSEEHETNIAFANGGGELCLSRINADQTRRWLLFIRYENGQWLNPEPAPFMTNGADFEGSYSPDGKRFFFSSNRPLHKGDPAKRDMDLWVTDRTGAGWGEPRNLGPAVNSQSNEYMPSVDREGNLYFERFGLKLARFRDGSYPEVENAAAEITNATNLGHPYIAPDGSYLLFDAQLPGSGKAVMFVSYRLKNGTWSQAFRLFDKTEPREYENCPTVSPDGKYLFFGRDHDIFWVSAGVIRDRRPKGL